MAKKNFVIVDGNNIRKSYQEQTSIQWSNMLGEIKKQGALTGPVEVVIDVTSLSHEEITELYCNDCILIHSPAFTNGDSELKSVSDSIIFDRIYSQLEQKEVSTRLLLISGDQDFIPAMNAWQRQSDEAYVLAFQHNISHRLIKAADKFIPLETPGESGEIISKQTSNEESYMIEKSSHIQTNSLLGKIISYSKERGYGFIDSPEGLEEEFFFHINEVDKLVEHQLETLNGNHQKDKNNFFCGLSIPVVFEDGTIPGKKYRQAVNIRQAEEG